MDTNKVFPHLKLRENKHLPSLTFILTCGKFEPEHFLHFSIVTLKESGESHTKGYMLSRLPYPVCAIVSDLIIVALRYE